MSQALFLTLLLALGAQRLSELALSRRNAEEIRRRGGFEVGASHFPAMRALHILWFAAAWMEVMVAHRPVTALGLWVGLICLAAGQGLRLWAISTLGWRWNVRIFVIPGEHVVRRGPYRWLAHPNYLGVVLELFGVPLLHGAWLTSLSFSLANAVLLRLRIRREEQALAAHSDYAEVFGS